MAEQYFPYYIHVLPYTSFLHCYTWLHLVVQVQRLCLKDGIDSIFAENGPLHLPEDGYKFKVITSTSDGTSVNFGKKTGLMKRMADKRARLVKIHCTNHRVELAVKEAIIDSKFKTVDDTYMIIFGLLKNSGKMKGIIQEACKSENIQHFTLTKITGTTQFSLIFELLIIIKLKFFIKRYNKKASEKEFNVRNKIFFKVFKSTSNAV